MARAPEKGRSDDANFEKMVGVLFADWLKEIWKPISKFQQPIKTRQTKTLISHWITTISINFQIKKFNRIYDKITLILFYSKKEINFSHN